jgi:hypothetical protein
MSTCFRPDPDCSTIQFAVANLQLRETNISIQDKNLDTVPWQWRDDVNSRPNYILYGSA